MTTNYIVDSPPEAKQRGSTLPRGPLLQPIVPPSDYKSHPVERLALIYMRTVSTTGAPPKAPRLGWARNVEEHHAAMPPNVCRPPVSRDSMNT